MTAIAPSSTGGRVNFPILCQGVWEPPVQGKDEQRRDDRAMWADFTSGIDERALAIIKHSPCSTGSATKTLTNGSTSSPHLCSEESSC
jgi:hypothetical protein